MTIKIIPAIAVAVFAVGVIYAGSSDWREKRDAMAAVESYMVDPDSAKFRNVTKDGIEVCGEVNAKNRMGGYTGYTHFRAIRIENEWAVTVDSDNSEIAGKLCSD